MSEGKRRTILKAYIRGRQLVALEVGRKVLEEEKQRRKLKLRCKKKRMQTVYYPWRHACVSAGCTIA